MTRSLQQYIHASCRELALDQDARHDLQFSVTGKTSMRDMTEADLKAVKARLMTLKGGPNGASKARDGKKYKPAPRADLRLVHVLWRLLAEHGVLKKPGRDGLNAFLRSRFENTWGSVPLDIDQMRDAEKINQVIRALKDWCKREGIALKK